MRIAHLSDLHIFALDGLRPADILSKRFVGGVNYFLRRRKKHDVRLAEAAIEDLNATGFDHVIVTGDLTNLGLPGEFTAARQLLDRIKGAPHSVTVLPGNHDAYAPDAIERGLFEKTFAGYLPSPMAWPWVRTIGDISIVAISTAVPTPVGFSSGRVGAAQLSALESVLENERGKFRLVAIHHPPYRGRGSAMRQLEDRDGLANVLSRVGAELVIHGHEHRNLRRQLSGPTGPIKVVGAPSTTYSDPRPDRRARYLVYTVTVTGNGKAAEVEIEERTINP